MFIPKGSGFEVVGVGWNIMYASSLDKVREQAVRLIPLWHPVDGLSEREARKIQVGIRYVLESTRK